MDAAPENEIRFGALFSAKLANFRFMNLGFGNRPLKKSVRDFFNTLASDDVVSLRMRVGECGSVSFLPFSIRISRPFSPVARCPDDPVPS